MSKFRHCAYIGVAMLAASGTASATTIHRDPQHDDAAAGRDGHPAERSDRHERGPLQLTRTGGTHPVTPLPDSPVSRFWAFCVELGQTISFGESVTYDVLPLASGGNVIGGIGATKADAILELLGAVYPDFTQVLANDQYAALQVSIWEITREDRATYGYDVFTGDVKVQQHARRRSSTPPTAGLRRSTPGPARPRASARW